MTACQLTYLSQKTNTHLSQLLNQRMHSPTCPASRTAMPTRPHTYGPHAIRSTRATQQWENFGALLFDLVLHPVVLKIHTLLRSSNEEHEHLANLLLQLWYHHHGCTTARHDHLPKAVESLWSVDATAMLLHLALSKCNIWCPAAPPDSVQRLYPEEFK